MRLTFGRFVCLLGVIVFGAQSSLGTVGWLSQPTCHGFTKILEPQEERVGGEVKADDSQADDQESTSNSPIADRSLPSIEAKVADFERSEGFVTFYWDEVDGKLWFEFENLGTPFLYVTGLSSGLGSNPVGLDRGQLGETRLVSWRRVGKRIYMEQSNLAYRSSSQNPLERQAIRDSFAQSIIFSAPIVAETEGRVLIDGTPLLVRDAHEVTKTLKRSGQGAFSLDRDRSFVHRERTKAFPENTELEVILTFSASDPGPRIRETTPAPQAVTLRQHHSMVKLPEEGYQPRVYHPRVGGFKMSYADYSAPLDQPLERHLIARHRLEKMDPAAEKSKPVEPIIYYLDPGVPQPVRNALLDGARWWNEAFEAAGFIDAFQVKMLPEDVDPLDVRYNVIQWVHRSTRGWSYGQSLIDPRTGEIIKGHVLLGSLRVRQDRLINQGLLDPKTVANLDARTFLKRLTCGGGSREPWEEWLAYPSETEAKLDATASQETVDPSDRASEVALARIRQLSAHEVGHTLGFSHNFAASTYDDRASVMDYPAPRIKILDTGELDLSDAYGVGIGSWDVISVKYAYSQFSSDEQEKVGLQDIVKEVDERNMLFVSDADARPPSAAHPLANLWDNGTDPVEELRHLMRVRQIAIQNFARRRLPTGRSLSELELAFVPIYLSHRYQVEAVAKFIGGVEYGYAVSGDARDKIQTVERERQLEALRTLLVTLEPEQLAIPEQITSRLHPLPYSLVTDVERFDGKTGRIFDAISAAETCGSWTVRCLTNRERLNRLSIHGDGISAHDVLKMLIDSTWEQHSAGDAQSIGIQHAIQLLVLDRLFDLSEDPSSHADVQAAGLAGVHQIETRIESGYDSLVESATKRHYDLIRVRIEQFRRGLEQRKPLPAGQPLPPGSPIGSSSSFDR